MRIEIPEDKKLVHESIIPVRWGDMDALGHVNNAVYFRYIEQARVNWLDSFGLKVTKGDAGVVVVNAFCNFLKQIAYPADLLVKTYIKIFPWHAWLPSSFLLLGIWVIGNNLSISSNFVCPIELP